MAYNTTPFHGKVMRIEKNNVATDYTISWSANVTLDMADASRNGQDWKEALPGQAGGTGSFEGYLVMGNTEQAAFVNNILTATPGTKLTDVKLLLDGSTNAITGNIYITGLSISGGLGGNCKHTQNFQFDGAVSITNAA